MSYINEGVISSVVIMIQMIQESFSRSISDDKNTGRTTQWGSFGDVKWKSSFFKIRGDTHQMLVKLTISQALVD